MIKSEPKCDDCVKQSVCIYYKDGTVSALYDKIWEGVEHWKHIPFTVDVKCDHYMKAAK